MSIRSTKILLIKVTKFMTVKLQKLATCDNSIAINGPHKCSSLVPAITGGQICSHMGNTDRSCHNILLLWQPKLHLRYLRPFKLPAIQYGNSASNTILLRFVLGIFVHNMISIMAAAHAIQLTELNKLKMQWQTNMLIL